MSAAGTTITVTKPPAAQIIGGHSTALATKATLGTALIVSRRIVRTVSSFLSGEKKLKQLKLIYGRFHRHNRGYKGKLPDSGFLKYFLKLLFLQNISLFLRTCIIFHIIRKPNSITDLLFIQDV